MDYPTLRAAHQALVHRLLDALTPDTLDSCAKRLGFWERGRPRIRHPLEAALVCDFALHDDPLSPLPAPQDPPASTEDHLLAAMSKARVDLWRVETIQPARAETRLTARLAGVSLTLTDQGLSQSAQPGDIFVIRPLLLEMAITSGVVLPIPLVMVEPMVAALIMKTGADSAQALAQLDPPERANLTASLFELGAAAGGLSRTSGI